MSWICNDRKTLQRQALRRLERMRSPACQLDLSSRLQMNCPTPASSCWLGYPAAADWDQQPVQLTCRNHSSVSVFWVSTYCLVEECQSSFTTLTSCFSYESKQSQLEGARISSQTEAVQPRVPWFSDTRAAFRAGNIFPDPLPHKQRDSRWPGQLVKPVDSHSAP